MKKEDPAALKAHALAFVEYCNKSPYTWAAHNSKFFHINKYDFKTPEEMYAMFMQKQLEDLENKLAKETGVSLSATSTTAKAKKL